MLFGAGSKMKFADWSRILINQLYVKKVLELAVKKLLQNRRSKEGNSSTWRQAHWSKLQNLICFTSLSALFNDQITVIKEQ